MYFNIVASGSKGNATLVASHDTLILIDFGITLIRLEEGLNEIHKTLKDIDAAIFTHDHSDHINGLKAISPKKMYALKGTLPSSLSNVVELYTPFKIKDVMITPIRTSHDATNPCGYVLEDNETKLVYMTDTGIVLEEVYNYINNPDYLIIESNHDVGMLMKSSRPLELKRRILSEHGHLCNEDSAFASSEIIGERTKEVVLAHLSEECNLPEVALEAYRKVLQFKGINISRFKLCCANQWVSYLGGAYEN